MLTTFVAAFVLIGLLFTGMTIGVMMGRKPIQGSCGGLGSVGVTGDCGMCGRKAGDACAKGESLPDDGERAERR